MECLIKVLYPLYPFASQSVYTLSVDGVVRADNRSIVDQLGNNYVRDCFLLSLCGQTKELM